MDLDNFLTSAIFLEPTPVVEDNWKLIWSMVILILWNSVEVQRGIHIQSHTGLGFVFQNAFTENVIKLPEVFFLYGIFSITLIFKSILGMGKLNLI